MCALCPLSDGPYAGGRKRPTRRAEGRVSIDDILDRMHDITISEDRHGHADARRYDYAPTYIFRGLTRLHLEYAPVG